MSLTQYKDSKFVVSKDGIYIYIFFFPGKFFILNSHATWLSSFKLSGFETFIFWGCIILHAFPTLLMFPCGLFNILESHKNCCSQVTESINNLLCEQSYVKSCNKCPFTPSISAESVKILRPWSFEYTHILGLPSLSTKDLYNLIHENYKKCTITFFTEVWLSLKLY